MVGVIGILVMFAVLFLLRIPAAFTMMLVGFLGVTYVTSFKAALGMIGPDLWNIFSNYGLTVIPMFILVDSFITEVITTASTMPPIDGSDTTKEGWR